MKTDPITTQSPKWYRSGVRPNGELLIKTDEAPARLVATVVQSAGVEDALANASLILEARSVYCDTGLTPRQLADHRAKLIDALCAALPFVEDAENDPAFDKGVVRKQVAAIRALIEES